MILHQESLVLAIGPQQEETPQADLVNTMDTGLFLTEEDKQDLVNFLKTLTDDVFLQNEEYKSPF